MYMEHPDVTVPKNPDAPIWRYIDFPKFVDMLERRALHFAQMSSLGDPFEGMPSEGTLERMRATDENLRTGAIARGRVSADEWMSNLGSSYEAFRLSTYLNCWHLNDYESMAMWRLYSKEGIALRSSFRRLTESVRDVPEQITAGLVVYRDRRDRTVPEFPGDPFEAGFRKGMSYDYEREVRATVLFDARPAGQTEYSYEEAERIQPKGLYITPVDLDVLIDAVYVAPARPLWFRELVEKVMRTYGLAKPLENSALDDRPNLT
jgi:hypothetical protein